MIQNKTVLVLGAGASCPYGFPDGRGLVSEIIKSASDERKRIYHEACFDENILRDFSDSLLKSDTDSIDLFLTHHSGFRTIGKFAIALNIMRKEEPKSLLSDHKSKWYSYLFSRLADEGPLLHGNAVNVITFNYDRSFEFYLYNRLIHNYGMEKQDAAEVVKQLNIHHVHGQLGYLEWHAHDDGPRHFSPEFTHEDVTKAAKHIKILYEKDRIDFPEPTPIQRLIHEAQNVFFLGFGYHRENMKILGFEPNGKDQRRRDNQRLTGTFYRWTDAEMTCFKELYDGFDTTDSDLDVSLFLRSNLFFLKS